MTFFNWQQPSAPAFDSDGRIQPLNVKRGELANRIITVGDPNRAASFQQYFDKPEEVIIRKSNMILVVYTGTVNGVPVSVVGTGMGFAMVGILLVQARAVIDGPIHIIRFGTCGSLSRDVPFGSFIVTDRIYGITQDYDQVGTEFPFHLSEKPYECDPDLARQIRQTFSDEFDHDTTPTVIGPGVSADTFYASQGRADAAFLDNNEHVIDKILEKIPEVMNFEMETYILAFLASRFPQAEIKVGAICIALAQRGVEDGFLSVERKHEMESRGAAVLLKVIATAQ
jgi:uridine phosphorylase